MPVHVFAWPILLAYKKLYQVKLLTATSTFSVFTPLIVTAFYIYVQDITIYYLSTIFVLLVEINYKCYYNCYLNHSVFNQQYLNLNIFNRQLHLTKTHFQPEKATLVKFR